METFGQKVRQALASRGLPLDRVAEATGLSVEQIEALGRDDFSALPEDDLFREPLRSFARLVDVDPDEVIADYRRERQSRLAGVPARIEPVGVQDARDEPKRLESPWWSGEPLGAQPSGVRPGRRRAIALLASAILALAIAAFLFWSRSSTAPGLSPPAAARDRTPMREAAEETQDPAGAASGMAVSPTDSPSRAPDSKVPVPAVEPPADASRLSIREHGVGRGVSDHTLVGEVEEFSEGERVWFWTLIQGGAAGTSIDHVWLHEGEEALRVRLKLGGARWRTHSYKDLNPGSEGRWAVEARDDAGRVLARREFACLPHL